MNKIKIRYTIWGGNLFKKLSQKIHTHGGSRLAWPHIWSTTINSQQIRGLEMHDFTLDLKNFEVCRFYAEFTHILLHRFYDDFTWTLCRFYWPHVIQCMYFFGPQNHTALGFSLLPIIFFGYNFDVVIHFLIGLGIDYLCLSCYAKFLVNKVFQS